MSAKIVEEVFSKPLAELIWTANTLTVFPATLQGFAVGSVLPAVFYMFRRGFRRGRGRFRETYTPTENQRLRPNIFMVAGKLSQDANCFVGFDSELTKDILGDMLLCDSLENKGHAEGHEAEVQRAFPVHYFASWLDLPAAVANLRFVPEMLVALLADQEEGLAVQPAGDGSFCVALNPKKNAFFQVFGRGVLFCLNPADLAGDTLDETQPLSVEELLMVRLGQTCEQAPEKLWPTRGATPHIPNLRPLSLRAAEIFRGDLADFLSAFGAVIPRRAITPMLETLIGLGLWQSFLASLAAVVHWEREGIVPPTEQQRCPGVFVDASCGIEPDLRVLSEQSVEELLRFLDEATVALASVRLLNAKARNDWILKKFTPAGPDATSWLNLLGDVRRNKHERSDAILNDLREKSVVLADKLEQEQLYSEAVTVLRSNLAERDPVRALAEAICMMMGDKLLRVHYLKFLDSSAMANEPHGLVRKRRVSRLMPGGERKNVEARSVVLSNTLLEALVHRYLVGRSSPLSLGEFLDLLKDNYGLWVQESPPGIHVSREDLLRNRTILERRLRDLGLLIGVNDAESMKHLRARYSIAKP